MTAAEIAKAFSETALLLELKGESSFKTRAFQNAARLLEAIEEPLESFVRKCRAGEVAGIGSQLCDALEEMFERGHFAGLSELRSEFPSGLLDIFQIPGLGPKKIKQLYEELQIASVEALHCACRENRIRSLKGFSEKGEQKILEAVEQYWMYSARALCHRAAAECEALCRALLNSGAVEKAEPVGEIVRALPVIERAEILIVGAPPDDKLESIEEIASAGAAENGTRPVLLKSGLRVLIHSTTQAELARKRLPLNGSASFREAISSRLGGVSIESDEREIFQSMQLAWIPPERRERPEIIETAQALFAENRAFPQPPDKEVIRGILHAHSTYSDGKNTLEDMALAVRDGGYEYFGISDHSQSAIYARGLRPADINRQHEEIDRLNEKLRPFRIFKGVESDILLDGELDYPEEILRRFDFVIASIHSRFTLSEAEMTARIIRALENPYTTILAHPTGRLLLKREGYRVNIPAIIRAAADNGVAIELNCNPRRLDLDWQFLDEAAGRGVPIAICPDAHSLRDLGYIEHGLRTLRKTGLVSGSLLNARGVDELESFFRRRRSGAS